MTDKLGITMDDKGRGIVYSDDGDGAELRVLGPEGNGDYYLQIYQPNRLPSAIRLCTSGGKLPHWIMSMVAGLFTGLEGNKENAARLFQLAARDVLED